VLAGAGNFPPLKDGTIHSPDLPLNLTHVAVMTWQYSGQTARTATLTLYVDGVQVAQETKPSEPRTRDNAIALGAASGAGYTCFKGVLAEVRIYSDATEDVAAMSNSLLKTYAPNQRPYNPSDPNGLFTR
jgi:hypothetical protein